ncbi:4-(cytidine 5'-diphospho)-2-C-methyl-D-erythritol kinase [Mongoliimonas terrestris]|uniref:4-(cytidine 5'-diphospho)-2-C-methyl-D-erythritol kinase n=1 Tax=Mongoliimonas terrestris TaxID=1709001 RepID=UPI000949753B|nr:4-(cytidine 5'-diphospho)-2-C-methyl-D-erythritol kinase [Mongoliimonas terrestris]
MADSELARAKVNLALHVVGRRQDGYHLLDTLVAFPAIGDVVSLRPDGEPGTLVVTGPNAQALADTDPDHNLVTRAAESLALALSRPPGDVAFALEKHLPVAAGLGGGSADAAAVLRLLSALWDVDPNGPAVTAVAAGLGADVPMCLASRPLRAEGIGERLTPVGRLPRFGILLANPGAAVSTPAVFRALTHRDNPPLPAVIPTDRAGLLDLLAGARNDLEPAAISVAPVIADVLARLTDLPGARLARMSGSGATCFALFDSPEIAAASVPLLAEARPGWWVRTAALDGEA